MQRRLVLASTSPYRRSLLERLQIAFETSDPAVDERPHPGELAPVRAERLSRAKALAVADRFADALIVGSDQVAALEGAMLDKPGARQKAIEQLLRSSGKRVSFYTGIAVRDTRTNAMSVRVVPCHVYHRTLTRAQIERYLDHEQPYDCAGSAKVEGLGIALLRRIEGDDPTALIGLPLIELTELLQVHGVAVPAP